MLRPRLAWGGFTLIEMVMTITILGVVGATVAVFMKPAIDTYFATNRRALLAEAADVVARRAERELRTALPNSIVTLTEALPTPRSCLAFLPTTGGGRYLAQQNAAGTGDVLDFTVADTSFDVLAGDGLPPAAGAQVVIYNAGYEAFDAYAGANRAAVNTTLSTSGNIVLASARQFPSPSPGKRFQLVADRTDYFACADGRLYRFSLPGIPAARPTACPVVPADAAIFADNVAACAFGYSAVDGLATLSLGFLFEGETLSLHHEIHVVSVP